MEPRNGSHWYSTISHSSDSSLRRGRRKGLWRPIVLVVVSAVALYFLLLGFMSSPTRPTPGNPEFASVAKDGTMATLGIQVQNSYSSQDDIQMYPWKHTAEPHRRTVMEVMVSWTSDLLDVEFRWEFVLRDERVTETRVSPPDLYPIAGVRALSMAIIILQARNIYQQRNGEQIRAGRVTILLSHIQLKPSVQNIPAYSHPDWRDRFKERSYIFYICRCFDLWWPKEIADLIVRWLAGGRTRPPSPWNKVTLGRSLSWRNENPYWLFSHCLVFSSL